MFQNIGLWDWVIILAILPQYSMERDWSMKAVNIVKTKLTSQPLLNRVVTGN